MKNFLLSFILTLIAMTSFGQPSWGTNFDSPNFQQYFSNYFYIDTVANPNSKWQIGPPTKVVFSSANSNPNALVTDTINPLPANDTSVIYVKHYRSLQPFHIFVLHFKFQMDGDSTDFGIIEISPDTGNTWINLLTQDTTYQMYWQTSKPTLTGSTNGWQSFDLNMEQWASDDGTYPIDMTADTILFRFTYITDSNSVSRDGWIIDDLEIEDWFSGVKEIKNDNLISISPNPTTGVLKIKRAKSTDNEKVQIMNLKGQILIDNMHFTGESIDVSELPNGIYLLKYSDTKSYSIKKFVVQHN